MVFLVFLVLYGFCSLGPRGPSKLCYFEIRPNVDRELQGSLDAEKQATSMYLSIGRTKTDFIWMMSRLMLGHPI